MKILIIKYYNYKLLLMLELYIFTLLDQYCNLFAEGMRQTTF